MASQIRKSKNRSVTRSLLDEDPDFASDQGQVRDQINELHHKTGTTSHSKTGAMSDAFAARSREIDALAADASSHPSPGLGLDLRIHTNTLAGSALLLDSQIIHLALFADPVTDPSPASSTGSPI